jgi:hypothetical protein
MSQQFHRYLRATLSASRKTNRASAPQYLGGIYFNHDPDYIMRMADEAAALGVGALSSTTAGSKAATTTMPRWATGIWTRKNTRTA